MKKQQQPKKQYFCLDVLILAGSFAVKSDCLDLQISADGESVSPSICSHFSDWCPCKRLRNAHAQLHSFHRPLVGSKQASKKEAFVKFAD